VKRNVMRERARPLVCGRPAGFTMIELLIVVAVAAILAAVALPSYTYYLTRGRIVEATTNLANTRVLMEQYFQDNGFYGTAGACGAAMPTGVYFTYACVATSSLGGNADDGYTITATGVANQNMGGFVYTIDQSNNRVSNLTAGGWTNPNPNNCWAVKKGGLC